ncbi:hypothetical protein L21SP2_2012 [Salinispira pacifica]|uniref:Uncharacterized protein n=1 Tax=Salinispira pacifica TaxID=1307761 RepID=V5WHV5_9SPIO|nr:hypothetical protein L21SP2_2012 [Salinispira pacifica]
MIDGASFRLILMAVLFHFLGVNRQWHDGARQKGEPGAGLLELPYHNALYMKLREPGCAVHFRMPSGLEFSSAGNDDQVTRKE